MNQLDIKKVANAVTEEPTELIITREPKDLWDKILVSLKIRSLKQSFFVKPLTVGECHRITSLKSGIKIQKREDGSIKDWSNNLILDNSRIMAEIIATYASGRKGTPTEKLIDYFMENLTYQEMEVITGHMEQSIDVIPFINSISSMKSLDLISPGIMEESLQNTGEIIAPGESSDQPQNISATL